MPQNWSYNLNIDAWDNKSLHDVGTFQFRGGLDGDCYAARVSGGVEMAFDDLVDEMASVLREIDPESEGRTRITYGLPTEVLISREGVGLVHLTSEGLEKNDAWAVTKRFITVSIIGRRDAVKRLRARGQAFLDCKLSPRVTWHYLEKDSSRSSTVFLENPRPMHRSFYPWLDEEPSEFMDRFLAAPETVLILRGDPGTGKTSFIQNLIWRSTRNVAITYEQELLKSDALFANFLTGDDSDILVMEDADVLLYSRERDDNPIMVKLLNIADGLLRFPNKKLVISANIVDESRIDDALLRPGRCFGAPVFRHLTFEEACEAADASGNPRPTDRDRDYSLAEVFAKNVGKLGRSAGSGFGFRRAAAL